ncbi:Myc-type [Macleaya cordata]|uniref:Myc-type n=1 Tax=Macleaya cordata TaxID=56857 RepID=A0A200QAT9_MACCD|nr:Myc-type [Macleaya cordata]
MGEWETEMREVEWLRPLVRTESWDYCVIWKLGEGSTRIIEWMGCCCGGAEDTQDDGENHLFKPCRDVVFPHPRRTKTCDAIAKLPTSIPLSSGYSLSLSLSLSLSHLYSCCFGEKIGTRVLIPFLGCLIELFAAKHVPKDQKIINFLMALYNISLEQETMKLNPKSNKCLIEQPLQGFMSSCPPSVDYLNDNSVQQYHPLKTQHNFDLFFEGSSTGSIPSEDPSSLDSGFNCGSQKFCALEQSLGITDNSLLRQDLDLISNCGDLMEEGEENLKVFRSSEGDRHKSKNLIAERNRRHKLKDRLYNLRALVPKITKMDILSTLGDSISFIKELQKKVKDLQNELKYMEEEDNYCNEYLKIPHFDLVANEKIKTKYHEVRQLSPAELDSSTDTMREMEVQVEVNQIGVKEFVLKFFCEQKRGGFGRLMEAMNSLGLKVTNANVTTFKGMVLNILILEAGSEEVQAQEVKDSLFDLTRSNIKPSF